MQDIRPAIPEKEVKWLGRTGGFDYAEHRGIEYAVSIGPVDPQVYSRQSGEAVVTKRRIELVDGSKAEHSDNHRALIVPSGTYAALAAKEAAVKAKAVRTTIPRPLDALAVHPLLQRRQAGMLRVRNETEFSIGGLSEAPRGIMLAGQEQQRGPRAIVDVLRAKGVELRLTSDKGAIVPIAAGGRMSDSIRELIGQAALLLLAHLRGQPLRCQLRHSEKQPPEAESLLVGGAAACAAHLAGELA